MLAYDKQTGHKYQPHQDTNGTNFTAACQLTLTENQQNQPFQERLWGSGFCNRCIPDPILQVILE